MLFRGRRTDTFQVWSLEFLWKRLSYPLVLLTISKVLALICATPICEPIYLISYLSPSNTLRYYLFIFASLNHTIMELLSPMKTCLTIVCILCAEVGYFPWWRVCLVANLSSGLNIDRIGAVRLRVDLRRTVYRIEMFGDIIGDGFYRVFLSV